MQCSSLALLLSSSWRSMADKSADMTANMILVVFVVFVVFAAVVALWFAFILFSSFLLEPACACSLPDIVVGCPRVEKRGGKKRKRPSNDRSPFAVSFSFGSHWSSLVQLATNARSLFELAFGLSLSLSSRSVLVGQIQIQIQTQTNATRANT